MAYQSINLELLETGILVIQFTKLSRQAIDEFSDALMNHKDSGYNQILVDSRVGVQPIHYSFSKLHKLFKQTELLSSVESTIYVAIVLDDSIFVNLAISFVRSLELKHVEFKFFSKNEYQNSIEWLANLRANV